MHIESFLASALFLLIVVSIAVTISKHLGLGSILGLLVAGVLVGPSALGSGVVSEIELVREFTELGIVLLLFIIGLEIKPKKLWEMRQEAFGLGLLQVLLSGVAIGAYLLLFIQKLSSGTPYWTHAFALIYCVCDADTTREKRDPEQARKYGICDTSYAGFGDCPAPCLSRTHSRRRRE